MISMRQLACNHLGAIATAPDFNPVLDGQETILYISNYLERTEPKIAGYLYAIGLRMTKMPADQAITAARAQAAAHDARASIGAGAETAVAQAEGS